MKKVFSSRHGSASSSSSVKLGIDVGGTFTHAVALDGASLKVIGKAMVPTTHAAKEGVARGVVESMRLLLKSARIDPKRISLIAHSTTQATNALLEGDVATVGIIGMGTGADGWRAKSQTNIRHLELAPGKYLKTCHRFYDTGKGVDEARIRTLVDELRSEGAEVFAVSEAFGVDHPENERRAAEMIREMGYPATAGAEITQLYGLKVRTRTAAINASMLPKMLETAEMTERSVRASGIKAPLMIMRSDGGIMDVKEMRRRPILTMLSGPAAGVAAALMYVKISDGVFLEVGGTSTDISVIKNGRPMVRTAEVGGHRLFLRTLDIRTVGIGGGSMVRTRGNAIEDVGPRSAHIAGLRYISFASSQELRGLKADHIQPKSGDPDDYLRITADGGNAFALTTTEAANALGHAREHAKGNREALDAAWRWIAHEFRSSVETIATAILDKATEKVIAVVRQFIAEYKLDSKLLALVGGGGGAETIVPHTAQRMTMDHWMAENAEVISAIGVALGMIRDTVERSIVNPTDADILKIRSEALESVIRMGAAPDSVEVHVEVDTRQKRLTATAMGVPELRARSLRTHALSPEERQSVAAKSLGAGNDGIRLAANTAFLNVYQVERQEKRLFGLITEVRHPVRVVDAEGIVRLKLGNALVLSATQSTISGHLSRVIDERTLYGDAGGLQPDVFILVSGRVIDLSGLASKEQTLSVLRAELERFAPSEPVSALVAEK